jgi:hypothetical protein
MKRWFLAWLRTWAADEQFVVPSPLSMTDARRRLADDLAAERRFSLSSWTSGSIRMRGRVHDDGQVKLQARRLGARNSWRPVLNGRLVPTNNGCQLVARLGPHQFVLAFSVIWLTLVVSLLVFSLPIALYQTMTGDFRAAGGAALVALAAAGFLVFFVGLTAIAGRIRRGEVEYLRTWLKTRLSGGVETMDKQQ